ncbi:MAG: response regulator transcription factor [Muribaculaceae bacterium]|jgi:DNA-binding response OmpR family regulator|nr:response regulator transcription factor [Muribaculaceae bacterium]
MKLLIIEDEKSLSDSIVEFLSNESYLCEQAFTYNDAMMKVSCYDYDCILLDLMLPGGSGLEILKVIKNNKLRSGVIIVSARDSLDDKVNGLKIGADDYLSKPFHLPELSMRIYALMRRKFFTSDNIVESGGVIIDLLSQSVSAGGKEMHLTKTEYQLLLFLIENKNRVVSKSALAEHLSGDMADMMDDYGFVYAHIKNLKSKLAEGGCEENIHTIYGAGYKWVG